ncbi:MAG: Spy/CpxP family protein refolding chaperone [Candidatus Binatia bacterium]
MANVAAVIAVCFVLTAAPVSAGESRGSGRFGHAWGSRNSGAIHARFGHSRAQRFDRPHFRFGGHHHFSPHLFQRHFHFGHRGILFPRPFGFQGTFSGRRFIPIQPSSRAIGPHYLITPRYEPRWHAPDVKGEPQTQKPLISLMLAHRERLELSPEQVQDLEQLSHDYRREAIRSEADLRIAEIDLEKLLKDDPMDLDRVKTKLQEIERMRADGRFLRIRTSEQGKALLSPEQREKLQTLAVSEQPSFLEEASSE